jgi:4-amino-4-deoxy-L-arabinose transferase-like glycosyltransferase
MTRRSFLVWAAIVLAFAAVLRTVWLTADPPTTNTVGVVWHDEGPWTHNARNKALWGVWRTDNWNPMYLAPVFTGLEYGAFSAFGVGTWQARTVPVMSGLAAVAFLMAGLTAIGDRRTALIGGALLAANYGFVMWNRAALMESTMTMFIVISWAAYALSERRPALGLVAGVCAVLAFFTKASAAFFVGAIVLDALFDVRSRAARSTLAGLAVAGAVIGLAFVLPNWSEFRFYNWQMSVARKPDYTVKALMDRASWLPLVHDFFTWMWPILLAAALSIVEIASRVRRARPAERLLVLWVLIGLLELVVHDSGNQRRYVMFFPAIIALAVIWLPRRKGDVTSADGRWLAVPIVCVLGYLVAGSALRVVLDAPGTAHPYQATVRWSAAAALMAAAAAWLAWPRVTAWLRHPAIPVGVALALTALTAGFDLNRFVVWARARQTLNYQASVDLGRLLPPGTLVQGKLANGLSLENRIRPIFIGREFGNYADRLQRDDARYILTYVFPSVGFESQRESGMIQEILDRYSRDQIVATFVVNETGGADRAGLIDKFPGQ